MLNVRSIRPGFFAAGLVLGVALAAPAFGGAAVERSASPSVSNTRIILADATAEKEDNFKKAMELLQRTDGSKPSRSDIDRAGHMLMESGPDAFEKAMNLLSRPNVKPTDITAAKQQMMKGGPDASAKAMQLLRGAYGY